MSDASPSDAPPSDAPPSAAPPSDASPSAAPLTPPTDLAVYAALVGRPPEIDPTLADPLVAAANARRDRPWSPLVLSLYLHQVYRAKGVDGLKRLAPPALTVNRPEVAAWVRRRLPTTARRAG